MLILILVDINLDQLTAHLYYVTEWVPVLVMIFEKENANYKTNKEHDKILMKMKNCRYRYGFSILSNLGCVSLLSSG